jgi:hypothetical protein
MAKEIKRDVYLKRLIDPSDPNPSNPTSYIDIPVIVSISFLDHNRAQGYKRTFNNSKDRNTREVHTKTVKNQSIGAGGKFSTDDSNSVDVERIDKLTVKNDDWRAVWGLVNQDPAPQVAPADPAFDPKIHGHEKTHVVRYNKDNVNDPSATPWVDVELIDVLKLKGAKKQRGDHTQVRHYHLDYNDPGADLNDATDPFNPTWSDIKYWENQLGAGPLPMIIMDTNGNPDPVRLDPFQNIVNVNWGDGLAVEFFDGAS